MKVIIAGGRDYSWRRYDPLILQRLHEKYTFTEVISGGCSGADRGGEFWAKAMKIPVKVYPAEWSKYGRAGGPMRNYTMAKHADAVILFPGGRGTESMRKIAQDMGLPILYDGGEG